MHQLQDLNIHGTIPLTSPNQLKELLPVSEEGAETIALGRKDVISILDGSDDRMIVVVGPCSIHNEQLGLEYARRLTRLAADVSDQLMLVMRVYFEKPRTTVGWKGLINDPHLNDTFDIATGMQIARRILLEVAEMGLPAATEMLEPITPQYIADLITLASIGARTTESPTHRQMASGLSMPVGYKNGTDGGLEVAINAMQAARSPHSFLGIDSEGKTCIVNTKGNPWGHLILRGGRSGPNFDAENVQSAAERLASCGLPPRLVVDCSHANSNKDFRRQSLVWNDVIRQRVEGNTDVVGLMLESNLVEGRQDSSVDPEQLQFGISITDACIGWDETEDLIRTAHELLKSSSTVSSS